MQLNVADRQIESNLPNESTAFTINASPKAFQILSGMYQNKPLAILRELCANALDAHTAAGNLEPFHIKLPNDLSPNLTIQDKGTGMSHQTMMTLYNAVFGSDKSGSNALIGGLGLGSKTPFSYCDMFSIISCHNGTKCTYSAFINDESIPAIVLLSSNPTTDPNGVTITIPVKADDFREFRVQAKKALKYFPKDTYVLHGETVEPVEYALKTDKYGIRKMAYGHGGGVNVVMGPIAYSVDYALLPEQLQLDHRDILRGDKAYDIFLPIGEVDIHPSREKLSYDKISVKKLDAALIKIESALLDDSIKGILLAPTKFDAIMLRKDILNRVPNKVAFKLKDIIYTDPTTGQNNILPTILRGHILDVPDNICGTLEGGIYSPGAKVKSNTFGKYAIQNFNLTYLLDAKRYGHADKLFWLIDESHAYQKRIAENAHNLPSNIFLIRGEKKAAQEFIDYFGGGVLNMVSSLPKPTKSTSATKAAKPVKLKQYDTGYSFPVLSNLTMAPSEAKHYTHFKIRISGTSPLEAGESTKLSKLFDNGFLNGSTVIAVPRAHESSWDDFKCGTIAEYYDEVVEALKNSTSMKLNFNLKNTMNLLIGDGTIPVINNNSVASIKKLLKGFETTPAALKLVRILNAINIDNISTTKLQWIETFNLTDHFKSTLRPVRDKEFNYALKYMRKKVENINTLIKLSNHLNEGWRYNRQNINKPEGNVVRECFATAVNKYMS